MGERRWTAEQLSAIETRDKTLLVSAAAGSGKTATLTERIIRQLTDDDPISVDSLLVVTFTNAAAAELRAKISKALSLAVANDPENKRLEHQLYMLPSAKIRTIDSFCNDILKNNSDRVGVPSNYRIADSAECELLAISIIEGLIEAVYNGLLPEIASPEDFERLADCLTDSKRTEELAEVFRVVHLKCETEERGVDSLLDLIDNYNSSLPVENNPYGSYLISRCREMAEHYASAVEKRLSIFSPDVGSEGKYIPVAESDLFLLRRILSSESFAKMRETMLSAEFVDLPRGKKVMTDAISSYTDMRKLMKADVIDFKSYFLYDEGAWETLFSSLHELLSILYRFIKKFDELFSEQKRKRGALSYADIERYTYKCLIGEDGEPTDIAMSLRERFSAVYIDEYQDVNNLQNRIFEVISRPRSRFMVGDIKQSIYGFRSARPEIFAEMKNAFPRLGEGNSEFATVFMSSNFRCNKSIVDFVNGVFDKAFKLIGDSIGYESGDRLGYAKIHEVGEPEYRPAEVYLLDKTSSDSDESDSAPDTVARKISELLENGKLDNGSPIKPSDIAIILRYAKGKEWRYADALSRLGIPTCISGAKEFFASSEVLLALCLLNTIDNPRRDIYLAGLMCSPLFGFTADELYLVRSYRKCETLYESLVAYVEDHEEFERGRKFLDTLAHYRAISEGISVDALIYKLYHETGLLALASHSGGKDNLMVLYDYARGFTVGAYKGLYGFISFINNLIDKKTSFDDAREGDNPDAVKIVTCHASKGLEYPIVFLVDASTRIFNKDRNNRLVYSEGFGISMRLRTPSGLALVENPVVDIINHYIERKQYEEELRVLYVALTRARERLFVYGVCPLGKREEYENKIDVLREDLSPYSIRGLASTLEIILVAGETQALSVDAINDDVPDAECAEASSPEASVESGREDYEELSKELVRRFTYEYPRRYMTELPEKMSVSLMSPTVLDGADGERAIPERDPSRRLLPAFADGGKADESAKRGIATHYFMQFCDFDRLSKVGGAEELSRLVSSAYLSKADGDRVRLDEIDAFRASPLFEKIRGAKKIYRELRFNVRLPAEKFTTEDERAKALTGKEVLVQGVIDCIIECEDGSLCLYDYKTDRLTREERADPALAKARLKETHREQLELYALAVEKIFGTPPAEVALYSLHLGDTVSIK